jgi:hypothetical protein
MKKVFIAAFMLFGTIANAQTKLTEKDHQQWNGFIDYIHANPHFKSLKGSALTAFGREQFKAYCFNKHLSYNYDTLVRAVQQELTDYRAAALNLINSKKAGLTVQDTSYFMPNLSPVDGKAGEKTLNWKFPSHWEKVYNKQGALKYIKTNDVYAQIQPKEQTL